MPFAMLFVAESYSSYFYWLFIARVTSRPRGAGARRLRFLVTWEDRQSVKRTLRPSSLSLSHSSASNLRCTTTTRRAIGQGRRRGTCTHCEAAGRAWSWLRRSSRRRPCTCGNCVESPRRDTVASRPDPRSRDPASPTHTNRSCKKDFLQRAAMLALQALY